MSERTFSYSYSAKDNAEIQEIKKKYMAKEEGGLEELKRLDAEVQKSGRIQALSIGIIGTLIFGFGMCLALEQFGSGTMMMVLVIFVGMIGAGVMFLAIPVYRRAQKKAKEKYAPRILELADRLSDGNK